MAEFLTFAAHEMLIKVASLATQEFNLLWGFTGEFAKLHESLKMLEAVLGDAEHPRQDQAKAVELWLEKLEEIAHLADDVLDDYGYELLRRKVQLRNQMKKKVLNFSLSNPIVFRVKMARKIKKINSSLDELYKKAGAFGLVARHIPLEATRSHDRRIGRETYSGFNNDENNIIGRKDAVGDIVKSLTNSNINQGNDLAVLAIVGMGGLGKTTLAKSVYHDHKIEQHYQEKMWVCVSTPFEVNSILKGILECLKPEQAAVQAREAICKILKEELKNKRYLLVLDDVWNEDDDQKWEELIGCLVSINDTKGSINDTKGSSILVTTRSNKVAKTVEAFATHDLEKLSDDECWLILKNRAIPVGSPPIAEDQEEIGRKIAEKCVGVPLVAKVLGSMMRSKKCDEWQSIAESDIWDLPEGEKKILKILRLSFDELSSPSLKQCFAYCSLFIKDFEFEKDDLIQHWMARGWLQLSSNQSNLEMEDIGNEYFNILLQNSFLQAVEDVYGENITKYKMHDLVHDLAVYVSKSKHLGCKFPNGAVLDNNSPEFKALRVLNLYKADIQELPDSIGKLKHLRYLNVKETKIRTLPNSLGQLYNLQTLKVPDLLEELPKEVGNLIKLRHVYFGKHVKVPAGILGRLTELRSLPCLNVGKGPGIEELGGLNQLKDTLSICSLEHVRNGEEAQKANLIEKKGIHKLTLSWKPDRPRSNIDGDEVVLEALRPHSNLEVLKIWGFMGAKFPSWFLLCSKLKQIELFECHKCEGVPILGHLPNLVHLKMERMGNLKCLGSEFYGCDQVPQGKASFPALKTLRIERAKSLVDWTEAPTDRLMVFPCLEELSLSGCYNLTSAPTHFPSLQKLEINSMDSGIPIASIVSSELTTLTNLDIRSVKGLACLPEGTLKNNKNLARLMIRRCHDLTCIAPHAQLEYCCESLRSLFISGCTKLRNLPDGLHPLCLEDLALGSCPNLESIPSTHGGFPSLRKLEINGCDQLSSLPQGIENCTSLESLDIRSCLKISSLPISSKGLPALRYLGIYRCPELLSLPSGLGCCTSLETLEIGSCLKISSLPISSKGLPALRYLEINRCPQLLSLPSGLGCFTSLEGLFLSELEDEVTAPRISFNSLTSPQGLSIYNLEFLLAPIDGFTSIRHLQIYSKSTSLHCDALQKLVSLQDLTIHFPNLETVPSLDKLTSLRSLKITHCSKLTCLPSGLAMGSPHIFTRLKVLRLGPFSTELDSFPALQVLPQLERLNIYGWPKLKSLPEQIQHFTRLTNLYIISFDGVEALPEWLGNLASLQSLSVRDCENLRSLPSVGAMKNLTQLYFLSIGGCPLLKERCMEESGPEWPKICHIPQRRI